MQSVDIFREVFADLRFPFISADLDKLRRGLEHSDPASTKSRFEIIVSAKPSKRTALVSSIRGLLGKTDVHPAMVELLAHSESIERAALSQELRMMAAKHGAFAIYELGDRLVWEEETLWPVAYSTFLEHLMNVMSLHQSLVEDHIKETATLLAAKGYAAENVDILSEYPR